MVEITLKNNEPFEKALRRFKKKWEKAGILREVKKRKYFPWFFLGMIMYILSFIIWAQGKPNSSYCNPDSFIQLHAIWHLMTAFSTWCFFKFFRTEKLINSE